MEYDTNPTGTRKPSKEMVESMRSIEQHAVGDVIVAMTEKGMFTLRSVGIFGVHSFVNGRPVGDYIHKGSRHVKVLCRDQDKAIAKAKEAGAFVDQLYQVVLVSEEMSGNYFVPVYDTVPIDWPKPIANPAVIREANEQGDAMADIVEINSCQDNTMPIGMAQEVSA